MLVQIHETSWTNPKILHSVKNTVIPSILSLSGPPPTLVGLNGQERMGKNGIERVKMATNSETCQNVATLLRFLKFEN